MIAKSVLSGSSVAGRGCSKNCACHTHQINRRGFLKLTAATAVLQIAGAPPVMAGPFGAADFASLVPPDKRLMPDWTRSLFARGEPTVYIKSRNELCFIGMPVAGICCGTVYLGGDGRLWVWDIFNDVHQGIVPENNQASNGENYVHPRLEQSPIDQGFAIKVGDDIRRLDSSGWSDVSFQGQYPVGNISFSDQTFPVSVQLSAYSPFIPLNADDSGLPVTVCEYVLKNTCSKDVNAQIGGWLQNACRIHSGDTVNGDRVNTVNARSGSTMVVSTFEDATLRATSDPDQGSMCLLLLGSGRGKPDISPETLFDAAPADTARRDPKDRLTGGITSSIRIRPGQSKLVVFAIVWHFPHSKLGVHDAATGNYYAKRFTNSQAVASYLTRNYHRLSAQTKLWVHTFYDSTLPYWFLDRIFGNISTLATSTVHRFGSGRYWGWEGVGCCEGTCTHVYHYAQAIGRVFPQIERDQRERVDFGVAFYPDTGMIGYRGEGTGPAVDGQCGRILGVYREHLMSADDKFLRRLWPKVRKAIEWVSRRDADGDGLLEGAQENTLDAAWYGKIPWISGLYGAALAACQAMATDLDDADAAEAYGKGLAKTRSAIEAKLFNGEYFIQIPEAGHEHSLGVYQASHIDQVQGQSWAWQVGLERVFDSAQTLSALNALYKYNFAPDVGPFKAKFKAGRPYALAGDGGLIMATNPQGLPEPFGVVEWQTGYFNECMSGFEHQAASHMIAEGMVLEGLAVTRAIHDRYHAAKRNPYNEIECSDHYARAMASYGSFISICGFTYHGPRGEIGFSPRITAERFRAPFIVAQGWGTFEQTFSGSTMHASIEVIFGELRLTKLRLTPPFGTGPSTASVLLDQMPVGAALVRDNERVHISLDQPVLIHVGQKLAITLT